MYRIQPMSPERAKAISAWRYPGEYSIYSFESNDETLAELLCGEYYACEDARGALVGYFCYGSSAQIPAEEDYRNGERALDIGLGLAPWLCGRGLGRGFLRAGIDFAKTSLRAGRLRLAVCAFNKRAIALYENCGFRKTGEARHKISKNAFLIYALEIPRGVPRDE